MIRWLKWFWMLNKRLYKKPVFLIMMAIIPLCVLALSFAAKQQSGFVGIVLAQEDPADPVSSAVVETLLQENSLIRYTADTPEAAVNAVRSGKADLAWVFPADMAQRLERFIAEKSQHNAVVTVVQREATVLTRLAQEKLTGTLYALCAKEQYLQYIRSAEEKLDGVEDSALLEYFDKVSLSEELFVFHNADGRAQEADGGDYLTMPVRGLLAILICLSAGGATLYYMHDDANGTFSLVKQIHKPLVAFACVSIASLNISIMALLALSVTGLLGSLLTEICGMLLMCICCSGFCLLLLELLPDVRWYAAVLPLLTVVMVAACPVFLEFARLRSVSHLLPPTYFIHAGHDSRYLLYMLFYSVVCIGITGLLRWCKTLYRKYLKKK